MPRCILALLLAGVLTVTVAARPAAADEPVFARDHAAVKQAQLERLRDKARRHFAVWDRPRSEAARRRIGQRARPVPLDEVGATVPAAPLAVGDLPEFDRIVNQRAGDGISACQAEPHLAFIGPLGVASWNDGQGAFTGSGNYQQAGWTSDGGATWTDAGELPLAGAVGGTLLGWAGDPVVAADPSTGSFWVAGLVTLLGSRNGVAVVRASFPGGTFTWDAPRVVVSVPNASAVADKEWIAVDPASGRLYAAWTEFTAISNRIVFSRSEDGALTWSPPLVLSSDADSGRVQGVQLAVDAAGRVLATWRTIGAVDVDHVRARSSLDGGVSFEPEATVASTYANFGSGPPGFNRLRAADNPMLAVDAGGGPHHGRAHLVWHESVNWYDDPLGGAGPRVELENNSVFARANAFVPGQRLRGTLAGAGTGPDVFRWEATQGTTYVLWADSLASMYWTMRVFCTDTVTALAVSGDNSGAAGGQGFVVFTAPTSGTYYLRVTALSGAAPGAYRIQTGVDGGGPERGRDQRDVFASHSDDGLAWSAPVRVNDEDPWFDDALPAVGLGADGHPVVAWLDWRDAADACGGRSHLYGARSIDGGATWSANVRLSSAATAWTSTQSNLAPNQGDYLTVAGPHHVSFAWSDGRLGNPDVFYASTPVGVGLTCGGGGSVLAGTTTAIAASASNPNPLFGTSLAWEVAASRPWQGHPASGTLPLAAATAAPVPFVLSVPDTAVPGPLTLTVIVRDGAVADTCTLDYTVLNPATAALATLVSASVEEGRVRVAWRLGAAASATLERAADDGGWQAVGRLDADGQGTIGWEQDVPDGVARLGFRLLVAVAGGTAHAGETWLDVAAVAGVPWLAVRPNPSPRGFDLVFSLAAPAPVRAEIVDLAGRRVIVREWLGLGAGVHVRSLETEAATLPAGVYGVRLVHGGRVQRAKVTLVR